MPINESDVDWIQRLKSGDNMAVNRLWGHYFERLRRIAKKQLSFVPCRVADDEDVALSALKSFCKAAVGGKFPGLADQDDLWRILVTITVRKARRQIAHARRQKRGAGHIRGESVFLRIGDMNKEQGIDQVAADEPTPAFAVELTDQLQLLMHRLGDDDLCQLALLKLQGYGNTEIAQQLQWSLRSVERRLKGIRALWSEEFADDS
jgi:DNA-directed RNA polymerase specialized sigma24 family protein